MNLDRYEYSFISFGDLPPKWKTSGALDELEKFLQYNWDQKYIFYNEKKEDKKQQYLDFLNHGNIKTKGYIGTISYKGEQLNIYPRVFKEDVSNQSVANLTQKMLLNNLSKWIEYCKKADYPFIKMSSDLDDSDNLKEFFITLYLGYIDNAFKKGLYYQYVDVVENCTSIKGKLNIGNYVSNKLPFGEYDKFLCDYSSFKLDNIVNRIIKSTCRYLLKDTSNKNKKTIYKILTKLNDVSDVFLSVGDFDKVKLARNDSDYAIIIAMSKMFIINKVSNYSLNKNDSFCFLFPTEVLFEQYIGEFLKETINKEGGYTHLQSRNKMFEDVLYGNKSYDNVFSTRYDILAKIKNKVFVLDTKYKELSKFNDEYISSNFKQDISQSDLYQILGYAIQEDCENAFLLYPLLRSEQYSREHPIARKKIKCNDSYKYINIHFIKIPFVYENNNDKMEEILKSAIIDILSVV